jgi:large subunit ribosomal protein L31
MADISVCLIARRYLAYCKGFGTDSHFSLSYFDEGCSAMKEGIHPIYRPVVFKDLSNGDTFLTRSAVQTNKTIQWEDGKEYPVCVVEVSSTSHPFYTGQNRVVDTEGRIEKFNKKYNRPAKA